MTIDKSLKATIIATLLIISISLAYFLVWVPYSKHKEELVQQTEAAQAAKIAASKERDIMRLQDINAFRLGEELYKDAKGSYSKRLEDLVGEYLEKVNQNPEPTQDGVCAASTAYGYTLLPSGGYEITFCLEAGTRDYNPGNRIATDETIR